MSSTKNMQDRHQTVAYRFDGAHDAIRFTFSDGKRNVQGLVSRDCVEDAFRIFSDDLKDWLSACTQHTQAIGSAALELWHEGAPEPVVVNSGNVRLSH